MFNITNLDIQINENEGFIFLMKHFINHIRQENLIPFYIPDEQIGRYLCAIGWELRIKDGKLVPTKGGNLVFKSYKKRKES